MGLVMKIETYISDLFIGFIRKYRNRSNLMSYFIFSLFVKDKQHEVVDEKRCALQRGVDETAK